MPNHHSIAQSLTSVCAFENTCSVGQLFNSHRAAPGFPASESAGSNRTISSVMLSGAPPSLARASSYFAAPSGAGSASSVAAITSLVTISVNPSEQSSKRSPA